MREEGEHVGTKLAKELLNWGTFGRDDKLTAVVVSGRQSGVAGGTDTLRVRVVE